MATDSITVESMIEQVSALSNHAWGIIEMARLHEDVPEHVSSALAGASKSMNDILLVMESSGRLRPNKPAEKPATETNGEPLAASGAESLEERFRRELGNLQNISAEILQLAHDGQESDDPPMILSAIKRIATDSFQILHSRLYDEICNAAKDVTSLNHELSLHEAGDN